MSQKPTPTKPETKTPDPPKADGDQPKASDPKPSDPDATKPIVHDSRRSAKELLEALSAPGGPGLERPAAALYLGYLHVRRGADGQRIGLPADVCAAAVGLHSAAPMVWMALRATNYIGLARALDICGLPVADAGELQEAASEVEAAALK